MAEVHKDQVPLRPVVSMVGTPDYNLAKYFDQSIKPYTVTYSRHVDTSVYG